MLYHLKEIAHTSDTIDNNSFAELGNVLIKSVGCEMNLLRHRSVR